MQVINCIAHRNTEAVIFTGHVHIGCDAVLAGFCNEACQRNFKRIKSPVCENTGCFGYYAMKYKTWRRKGKVRPYEVRE